MARSAAASVTITDVRDGVAFKEVELYKIDSPSTPPTGLGFNVNTGAAADAATGWTAVAPTVTVNQLLYRAVRGVQLDAGATLWTANPSEDWVISLASGIRGQIGSAGAAIAFDVDANLDSDADKYELIQSYRGDNAVNNADIYWQVTTGQVFQWQNPSTTDPTIPAGQSFTDLTTLQGGFLDINGITEVAFSPGEDGNIGIGEGAVDSIQASSTLAIHNIGIGYNTLTSAALNGENNVALGYQSLLQLTTGDDNIGLGSYAGWRITSGSDNIAIGSFSVGGFGTSSGAESSVGIGRGALGYNVNGTGNVSAGNSALGTLYGGKYNAGFGQSSGGNSYGSFNTFIHNNISGTSIPSRKSNTIQIGNSEALDVRLGNTVRTDNLASNIVLGEGAGVGGLPTWADRDSTATSIVSNGDFSNGTTGWTKSQATSSLATAEITREAAFGSLSLVDDFLQMTQGTSQGYVYQTLTTVVGRTYTVTAEVQTAVGRAFKFVAGTSVGGEQLATTGLKYNYDVYAETSISFVATSTSSTISYYGFGTTGEVFQLARVEAVWVAARNTIIGKGVGTNLSTGSNNICIGTEAGKNITSGEDNICIGSNANGPSSGSNNITIGKSTFVPLNTAISNTTSIGNSTADRLILNGRDALTVQYSSTVTPTSITQYGDQQIMAATGFVPKGRKYLISFSLVSTSTTVINCKLKRRVGTGAQETIAQIETSSAGTNSAYSYEVQDVVSEFTDDVVYAVTGRADSTIGNPTNSTFQLTIKKVG